MKVIKNTNPQETLENQSRFLMNLTNNLKELLRSCDMYFWRTSRFSCTLSCSRWYEIYKLTNKAITSEAISMQKTLFQPEDSITPASRGPTAAPTQSNKSTHKQMKRSILFVCTSILYNYQQFSNNHISDITVFYI